MYLLPLHVSEASQPLIDRKGKIKEPEGLEEIFLVQKRGRKELPKGRLELL